MNRAYFFARVREAVFGGKLANERALVPPHHSIRASLFGKS